MQIDLTQTHFALQGREGGEAPNNLVGGDMLLIEFSMIIWSL